MKIHDMRKEGTKMGRTKLLLVGATFGTALLASLFFVAGCGHDTASPVGPGSTGQDGGGTGALQWVLNNYSDPFGGTLDSTAGSGGPLRGAGSWTLSSASDTAFVGKAGGTITLKFGAVTSTLKIPADAVCSGGGSCVVKITATALFFDTPLGPVFLYDFGPDGLLFAKACEFKVYGFTPNTTVNMYWLNPATNVWELQQQVKALAHGEVKFVVTHFSKYGISR